MLYFAYGSNMRRARLEGRVGQVVSHGHAVLDHFCHAFAKRGADGTAKGTIVAARDDEVHGVLYQIDDRQLELLTGYEGGYRRVEVRLGELVAVSFEALRLVDGLRPTHAYLAHYFAGMAEHGLPADYVSRIRQQALAAMTG